MVRPLLTALLTVAAVAWPAAALEPVAPSPPDATLPVATPLDPYLDTDPVAVAASTCRIFKLTQDPSDGPLPDIGLELDPDDCFSTTVNKVYELVWPWLDLPLEVKILDNLLGGSPPAIVGTTTTPLG